MINRGHFGLFESYVYTRRRRMVLTVNVVWVYTGVDWGKNEGYSISLTKGRCRENYA